MKHVIYRGMMNGLSIDRCTRDEEYNMVKHWHPEYEIQYYLDGSRRFFIEGKTFNLKPGSLVIVNADQIHCSFSDNSVFHDRVLLLFENSQFCDYFAPLKIDLVRFFAENSGVIEVPLADRKYLKDLFEMIAWEVSNKYVMYHQLSVAKLLELISYIIRLRQRGSLLDSGSSGMPENELVNKVKWYIRNNYNEVGSLEDLAKYFYLDKSYLSRVFKKESGYTVGEFINIQKIQAAQKLLEDTTYSISEVSEQVGYGNVTYFNRVFKRYVESSPLQYRKKKIVYKETLREKNNF
ncbi:AraC family transcriptional regulator [Lapidilactobacillus luobeiensis]|uniref:AraC family transcriptional regulator n=1 Tax=Lapidilactobacillus luobeiensis TaxID=2950371 RepID=UPI0021C48B51|nr:AraC family transcriptional regulator [Lapidilactobacillus luobeiensis]